MTDVETLKKPWPPIIWRWKKNCFACESPMLKAIYGGLPLKICSNEDCNMAWGLGTLPMQLFSDGGGWGLLVYEGSYFKALVTWFKITGP